MFDLGSDDKKELQENMKEIKNLIDDEGKKRSQSQNNNNQDMDQARNQATDQRQKQPDSKNLNSQSDERDSESSGIGNLRRNQDQDNQSQSPHEDKVINEEKSSSRRPNSSESEKEDDSDENDISGDEPLFLREEQFTEIREMVEEMSYLSQEMGQKVDRMKKTVRNERDISKDSEELVQAFNQRRSKIESTINSGQK